MGLMKQAYDTYCFMEKKYAGKYDGNMKEPLVPVSHQIVKADIAITLDAAGSLITASSLGKDPIPIIIPVTEQSAGRTGSAACPHPLCDQIRFYTPMYPQRYEAFLKQLHDWQNSSYGHPKLNAIAAYVEQGTILQDLEKLGLIELDENGFPTKEKLRVCWCVEDGRLSGTAECWKDETLFQSFISYYAATKTEDPVYCMISGDYGPPAVQHPKKIISFNPNAKLISANDTSGFTYRGRFEDDLQAVTISYDTSQKMHSALRWLAVNQGVVIGGRTFLCWNPQGVLIPKLSASFLPESRQKRKYSDYKKELDETLKGWKERMPKDAQAVVAAFDAATTGRLALTYYSELAAGDFLERLHHWDNTCSWYRFPFGIQSPSLFQIANLAFGTLRTSRGQTQFEADERVLRQQIQRLVACRVDKAHLPGDFARGVVEKASNLKILPDKELKEQVLFIACAVIRKYHYDNFKEEWSMALEPEKKDISYQYGRLLAVLEKVEKDTYESTEKRETNAIRMQAAFVQRPQSTQVEIYERLRNAYFPRLKTANQQRRYHMLIGEIMEQISQFSDREQKQPLKDTYLMGYYLQRNELYKSKEALQEEEV